MPFYYFLPEDIIKAHKSKRFQGIPRNPRKISAAVWYYFDIHASSNAYSVNDPIWMLTYMSDWYLKELTRAGYIYPLAYLFREDRDLPYMSWAVYKIGFMEIIPKIMIEHNLAPIIDYVQKHRCFEDFQDDWESKYKSAFINQWYHLRTKHPEVPLEVVQGSYDDEKEDYPHELADKSIDVQDEVEDSMRVESFLNTLSEKDRQILNLRMDKYTYEEIAEMLGYKTHSAVIKRIKRIGEIFQKYAKTDLGFD